jgi:hypothetical protein
MEVQLKLASVKKTNVDLKERLERAEREREALVTLYGMIHINLI